MPNLLITNMHVSKSRGAPSVQEIKEKDGHRSDLLGGAGLAPS